MIVTADLVLVENSTAGRPPLTLLRQVLEFSPTPIKRIVGVDGHVSEAKFDTGVVWKGGRADQLKDITDVRATRSSDGAIVLAGSLNRNFVTPKTVPGGVTFAVFPD